MMTADITLAKAREAVQYLINMQVASKDIAKIHKILLKHEFLGEKASQYLTTFEFAETYGESEIGIKKKMASGVYTTVKPEAKICFIEIPTKNPGKKVFTLKKVKIK